MLLKVGENSRTNLMPVEIGGSGGRTIHIPMFEGSVPGPEVVEPHVAETPAPPSIFEPTLPPDDLDDEFLLRRRLGWLQELNTFVNADACNLLVAYRKPHLADHEAEPTLEATGALMKELTDIKTVEAALACQISTLEAMLAEEPAAAPRGENVITASRPSLLHALGATIRKGLIANGFIPTPYVLSAEEQVASGQFLPL